MNFDSRDIHARSKRLNTAGVISTPYRQERKVSLLVTKSLAKDEANKKWIQDQRQFMQDRVADEYSNLTKEEKNLAFIKGLPAYFTVSKVDKEIDLNGLSTLYKSQLVHEQFLKKVATERAMNKMEVATKNLVLDISTPRPGKSYGNKVENNPIFAPKKIEAPWRGHSTFISPSAQKKLTFENFKMMCAEPPRTPPLHSNKSNVETSTPQEPSTIKVTPKWNQKQWKIPSEPTKISRDWMRSDSKVDRVAPRIPMYSSGGKQNWNGPRPGPPPDEKTLRAYRYEHVALSNVPPSQQQYVQKQRPKVIQKPQRPRSKTQPTPAKPTSKPPSRLRPVMLYPKHIPGPKTDNIFIGHYDGSDSDSSTEIQINKTSKENNKVKTPEKPS